MSCLRSRGVGSAAHVGVSSPVKSGVSQVVENVNLFLSSYLAVQDLEIASSFLDPLRTVDQESLVRSLQHMLMIYLGVENRHSLEVVTPLATPLATAVGAGSHIYGGRLSAAAQMHSAFSCRSAVSVASRSSYSASPTRSTTRPSGFDIFEALVRSDSAENSLFDAIRFLLSFLKTFCEGALNQVWLDHDFWNQYRLPEDRLLANPASSQRIFFVDEFKHVEGLHHDDPRFGLLTSEERPFIPTTPSRKGVWELPPEQRLLALQAKPDGSHSLQSGHLYRSARRCLDFSVRPPLTLQEVAVAEVEV